MCIKYIKSNGPIIFRMTLAKNVCFIHSTNIATTGTFILDMMISYLNERNFIDALEFLVINNIGEPLDENT